MLTLAVLLFIILAFSIPKNKAELNQLNPQKFSDINPIKKTILTEQDKKKKVKQLVGSGTKENEVISFSQNGLAWFLSYLE